MTSRPWTPRRLVGVGLKVAAVGAIAWFLATSADLPALQAVLLRLPIPTLLAAIGLLGLALVVASQRWRMLMRAFGVEAPPPLGRVLRLTLVGLFYNTYVPGAVGGDVVRGVLVRRLFRHPAASYVVVLLERLIGLSALALVLGIGVLVGPDIVDRGTLLLWIGILAGLGVAIVAAALATGRLQALFRLIPPVTHPGQLGGAFAISFVGHGLSLAIFALLAHGLAVPVAPTALLLVVPLALVAAFVPLSIAGIGPRETALVGLLSLLGVPRPEALGLSLAYALTVLVVAGFGGLAQLLGGPLEAAGADSPG
ncbi:MAG: lysylphosphatidylglycerol synthase transmembrane domain-containing protein [bacterium]